jgi:hypothetical protein
MGTLVGRLRVSWFLSIEEGQFLDFLSLFILPVMYLLALVSELTYKFTCVILPFFLPSGIVLDLRLQCASIVFPLLSLL